MQTLTILARGVLLAALLMAATRASAGQVRGVDTADGFAKALAAAQGGDVILLAPGEYRGSFGRRGLHASEREPTVIGAADPERPPLLRGRRQCLHLSHVSHVVVRDLVLVGASVNGLNIDDGGPADPAAHHIVVENLTVRDIGPSGNNDGIKLSGVDDFLVVGCTIERWGARGSAIDMVGCHRGLIADCTFGGKPDRGASGVQAKGGSSEVCVARSVFRQAGLRPVSMGGSTGLPFFRPPAAGYEIRNALTVGNVISGSMAAVAFVGADACEASYNTIVRPTRWVLRILQESRGDRFVPCRKGLFRRNLVVWGYRDLLTAVNVGPATSPESFRFEANWWYCEDRAAASTPLLPSAERGGTIGRSPDLKITDGSVSAPAAPGHGAHAPAAAEEFHRLASPMAPWAYRQFTDRTRPAP
jgi:hypothetical protein